MAFDQTNVVTAHTVYSTVEVANGESGKKLKVQIGGDKILEETVPEGKAWEIVLRVEVHETDA